MTPEEIAEIERLANAATPGPWESPTDGHAVIVEGSRGKVGYPPSEGTIASLNDGEYIENHSATQDAAFIAASRAAVPALCAALREAWKANDSVRNEAGFQEQWRHQADVERDAAIARAEAAETEVGRLHVLAGLAMEICAMADKMAGWMSIGFAGSPTEDERATMREMHSRLRAASAPKPGGGT